MKENFTYKPTTYWVTGLSGAGKSTLLPHLLDEVKKKSNLPTICFDGDELRNILNAKSFDVKSRIENGLKYCRLCKFLNEQGKILPRRITGTSLKFQRKVSQAVKRARHIAVLPYVTDLMK